MNFLISLKLVQTFQASMPWGMLHGQLYHSAVFICSACHLFTSVWRFYVRNPRDSILADEGSAGLSSHGTHERLSDKETVNADRKSCVQCYFVCNEYDSRFLCCEKFNPTTNPPKHAITMLTNIDWGFYGGLLHKTIKTSWPLHYRSPCHFKHSILLEKYTIL